jgi:hypothetical protein
MPLLPPATNTDWPLKLKGMRMGSPVDLAL